LKVAIDGSEGEQEVEEDHEPEGQNGINQHVYYVSTNIIDFKSWVRLPLITSKQMRQARRLNYVFTGDLER